MTRHLRVVLNPSLVGPPGSQGFAASRRSRPSRVVMDCQLESRDDYDWLVEFLGDKLVFVERWEDGQEG